MFPGKFRERRSFVKRSAWLWLIVGLLIIVVPSRFPWGKGARGGAVERPALSTAGVPRVTAPPQPLFGSFRENDGDAARRFYRKHLDVKGLAVVASEVV